MPSGAVIIVEALHDWAATFDAGALGDVRSHAYEHMLKRFFDLAGAAALATSKEGFIRGIAGLWQPYTARTRLPSRTLPVILMCCALAEDGQCHVIYIDEVMSQRCSIQSAAASAC